MIKNVMIITSAILALFIIIGISLPNSYEIKRTVTINAPVEKVHALVGDLNQWPKWTPWLAADPSIRTTVVQASGVGASQKWEGNSGNGSLTFTSNDPQKGIDFDLYFDNNSYRCDSGFIYTPSGNMTVVSWYMRGSVDFPIVGGYVAYMTESMNSDMFDNGLLKLKKMAEAH